MPEIRDFVPSGLREEYGHFHPEDRRRESHVGMEPFGFIEKLQFGQYTPTLTNVLNLDGSTAYLCHWLRLGDVVLVGGAVAVDPTSTTGPPPGGNPTELRMTLPVASNFAAVTDCAGTAVTPGLVQVGAIYADTTNDQAYLSFLAQSSSSHTFRFTYFYRVI